MCPQVNRKRDASYVLPSETRSHFAAAIQLGRASKRNTRLQVPRADGQDEAAERGVKLQDTASLQQAKRVTADSRDLSACTAG